ncbi:MAG: hypothetical protein DRH57_06985 [Candidatus Cloacimonadota bacterium]|nr:MAG: hypothetical protein DRH57_06985 [Candidatus Cloacimonadota bacterium]
MKSKVYLLSFIGLILAVSLFAGPPNWTVIGGTSGSMTVIARVDFFGESFTDELDNILGAFGSGGESDCRSLGAYYPTPLDFWYMTVVGDTYGETISFKIYDTPTDTIYDCYETVSFESGSMVGSFSDPFLLHIPSGTIEGIVTLSGGSGNVQNVEVSAGIKTVNPDITGYYSIKVVTDTFDVTASLVNYHDSTLTNVVVVDSAIVTANFTLTPIQPGTIQGTINLVGGSGNVQNVEVTAGDSTTHPNASGEYEIGLMPGIYNVIAHLTGYIDSTVIDVQVLENQATNVNIDLYPESTPGTIEGNVSLIDTKGNVQDVEITAGDSTVHPNAIGDYVITIQPGIYDVTACLIGYTTETVEGVIVYEGLATTGIDFILEKVPSPPNWRRITGTQYSMVVMASVTLNGQPFVDDGNNKIGAFGPEGVGDCRCETGIYYPQPSDFWYMTIVGNANGQPIEFMLFDDSTNCVYECIETVIFSDNATVDTVLTGSEPVDPGKIKGTVTLNGGTGNPEDVQIIAGPAIVNPLPDGQYTINLMVGTYDVYASLGGYETDSLTSLVVNEGQILENNDLTLNSYVIENVLIWIDGNDVHLSWSGPEGVIYHIYHSTSPYTGFGLPFYSTTDTTCIDYGAADSTKYFYYITAE